MKKNLYTYLAGNEYPGRGIGVAIAAFQDAQLADAATHIHNAGNAGGKVGGIVLKSAGGKGCFKAVTREQVIPHVAVNGIRLVTVGHNGGIVQGQNRVIDDQVGIFQLGGMESTSVVGGKAKEGSKQVELATRVYEDTATNTQPDGNNVDVDSQSNELAKVQLHYQALKNQMNGEFTRLRSAMKT